MERQPEQGMKILFCTDFSDNARQAFDSAVLMASRDAGSELILLHVLPEPDAQFWKSYIYEVDGDVDTEAKRMLDELVDREYRSQIPAGMPFRVLFRIGKAGQAILDVASEVDAGMIVIGRQGERAWKALFFGSVAAKVVQRATCPVLIIPPKDRPGKSK